MVAARKLKNGTLCFRESRQVRLGCEPSKCRGLCYIHMHFRFRTILQAQIMQIIIRKKHNPNIQNASLHKKKTRRHENSTPAIDVNKNKMRVA